MTNKFVGFRLPVELLEAIDSYAQALGKNRTAVVIQALDQVFRTLPAPPPSGTLQALQQRMDRVEQELEYLTNKLTSLEPRLPD